VAFSVARSKAVQSIFSCGLSKNEDYSHNLRTEDVWKDSVYTMTFSVAPALNSTCNEQRDFRVTHVCGPNTART
jgi:hypothetical protein